MKRTKEQWNKPQPPAEERDQISSAREFDGEDLSSPLSQQIPIPSFIFLIHGRFSWSANLNCFCVFDLPWFSRTKQPMTPEGLISKNNRGSGSMSKFSKRKCKKKPTRRRKETTPPKFSLTQGWGTQPSWDSWSKWRNYAGNRGMLEDDFTQRKSDIVVSTKASNQQLVIIPGEIGLNWDLFWRAVTGKAKQGRGGKEEAIGRRASGDQTA